MIFLDLFLGFLKVGCFTFGGGYAAIPLIRDVVLSYGWLSDDTLAYMIAVSESTPGPIMINLATYVGSTVGRTTGVVGGVVGAVIATFAVVLPAFIIILLIMAALGALMNNKYVRAVLDGVKPCVIGIIFSTGLYMIISNFTTADGKPYVDWRATLIAAVLTAVILISKPVFKRKVSPIALILVSAFLGIAVYGV